MSRRTATRPEVRVGGFWLSSIVPQGWGELKHSTRTNGSWQASWTIPNTKTWTHPALVDGANVEICLGPVAIWSGSLVEPDWDAGEFIALGACRDAETAPGLDGSGNSSTAPNTVIDAAIADGGLAGWTRVGDFGTTPVADASAGLVTIWSILDNWAQKNGRRWFVNELRQVDHVAVDETTPKWFIVPGSGRLGAASENKFDRIYARYIDSTTGARATVRYPSTGTARLKVTKDLTDRGAMTSADATTIITNIWNEQKGRVGFTNGWTLVNGQITTVGGGTADGALVKAGDTVAALGLPDARGIAHNTLVVLGDTDYDWEDDELQANPTGTAARDTESVLEQVGNLAVDAMAASATGAGDTGWISMTTQDPGNLFAAYRVLGKECSVRLSGSATIANAAYVTAVTAANGVPSAARPSVAAYGGALIGGRAIGVVGVDPTGAIILRQDSGASATGTVAATIAYPIG